MKVRFKNENGILKNVENGMRIETGLISSFPHTYNPDGSGSINIPDTIVGTQVKLVKAGISKKIVDTSPYVQYPALMNSLARCIPGMPADFGKPIVGDVFPEDHAEKQRLKDAYFKRIETVVPDNTTISGPVELTEQDEKELFIQIPIENLLVTLGFKKGVGARWYHPVLEGDINFDSNTDSLQSLIFKVFRNGYEKGRNGLKADVERAIKA